MSAGSRSTPTTPVDQVRTERTFPRFTRAQRWEPGLLILTFLVLLLTGLVQKYRLTGLSQQILSTPERLELIQTIHRLAAVVLTLEALYHVGQGLALLARRRLSGAIFLSWQDIRDAVQMLRYLLFLTDRRLILYARPRILAEISLGNIHCLLEKTVHFAMKNRTALGVVYRAGSGQAGGRIWLCMNDPGAWKKAIRKGIPENQGLGAGAQRTAAA